MIFLKIIFIDFTFLILNWLRIQLYSFFLKNIMNCNSFSPYNFFFIIFFINPQQRTSMPQVLSIVLPKHLIIVYFRGNYNKIDLKGWIQSYLIGFGLAQIQLIGVEEMILGFSEPNPYPCLGLEMIKMSTNYFAVPINNTKNSKSFTRSTFL